MQLKMPNKSALAVILGAAFMLSACSGGGGGGSATPSGGGGTPTAGAISGIAAAGSAVIGSVSIKDRLGAIKSSVIAANGRYSVDVVGMTGPFMLKAEGAVGNASVSYYSAATSTDVGGSVNVTPLTDLLVSNVTQQLAATAYQSPAGFSAITEDKLAAAQIALKAKLQPVLSQMGVDSSVNLLHTSFATDHAGLDAVLDVVKVAPDSSSPNKLNIINKATGIAIGSDDVTKASDDATPVVVGASEFSLVKTDLQAVTALAKSFTDMFATGVPSEATLATLVDTNLYLDSGNTFSDDYKGSFAGDKQIIGLTLTVVSIAPVPGNPNRLAVDMVMTVPNSSNPNMGSSRTYVDKSSGSWKLIGSQTLSWQVMWARAERFTDQSNWSEIKNGLHVEIDTGPYNSTHAGVIDHALVTGSGLPQAGVRMSKPAADSGWDSNFLVTYVAASSGGYATNTILACDSPAATSDCVTVANTADNSIYTVKLYDISGNVLNGTGYEIPLLKKPLDTNALTNAMFPELQSITANGISEPSFAQLMGNGNMAFSWTLPAGLKSNYLDFYGSAPGYRFNYGTRLLSTDLSKTMAVSITQKPTYAGLGIDAFDAYGRAFVRSYGKN